MCVSVANLAVLLKRSVFSLGKKKDDPGPDPIKFKFKNMDPHQRVMDPHSYFQ
jgi:hypothetical protein